ncbi:MAG TPA: hypothetical protein VLH10_15260, partial [Yinghuangia sp.]|nr:hypothetical protein [Yinghuangia sp.]
ALVDLAAALPSREPVDVALLHAVGPGVRTPDEDAIDAVTEILRGRRLLLVLDGCDHVADEAARVVEVLLATCPYVRILATAREPLHTTAEFVWPVPPLGTEAGTDTHPGHATGHPDTDAARLFVDRARLARRDVAFTEQALADVDRIVRAVDGIPLAIELAAARVRMLSVREIADTLDLRMLADRRRRGDTRHRTMHAAIDWSYYRLSVSERVLLRRLAVFRGPWSTAAAVAVCADEHLPADVIPRHLDTLADKSFVTRRLSAHGQLFRMLAPIRDYAYEPPDVTDHPTVRAALDREMLGHRHLLHHLALAQRTWPGPGGPDAPDEREDAAADFRAALTHAHTHRPHDALRLAVALGFWWRSSGRLAEGLEATNRALSAAPDAPAPLRAAALAHRAALLLWLGDEAQASATAAEAARVATRAHEPAAHAHASVTLAGVGLVTGAEDALRTAQEALDRARAAGGPHVLGDALCLLALSLLGRGDFAAMAEAADECLAVARAGGHVHAEAMALWCRAHAARARLDLPHARELAEAIGRFAEGAESGNVVDTLIRCAAAQVLALVDVQEGNPQRAKERVREELARSADTRVPWGVDALLQARAYAELAAGEYTAARGTGLLLHDRTRDRCAALAWRALDVMMQVALEHHDPDAARAHAHEIRTIGTASADPAAKAVALLGLAQADLLTDAPGSAEVHALDALGTGHAAGLPQEVADAFDTLAHVAATRGRLARAAYLAAAADAVAPTRLGGLSAGSRTAVRNAVIIGLDTRTRAAARAEGA